MAREKNDSSANPKGMRNSRMPSDHFEKEQGEMGHECKLKYATEFGNPKDLDRSTEGLASYVKKNKAKH
jgi:hypothetical protein